MRFYPLNPILSVNFLCLSSKNRSSFRYFPVFPHRIRGFRFYVVRQSAQFVLFYLVFIFLFVYIAQFVDWQNSCIFCEKCIFMQKIAQKSTFFARKSARKLGFLALLKSTKSVEKCRKSHLKDTCHRTGAAAWSDGRANARMARPASQVARAGFWGCGVYTSTSRALTFILSA